MKRIAVLLAAIIMSGCITTDLTIKDHRASFLFDNAGTRSMNILAYNLDDGYFNNVVNRMKANNDKVSYLYVGYNKGDGPGITSIYVNDVFGGTIDSNKTKLMESRIKKIRDKDLKIVGWLFADDNQATVKTWYKPNTWFAKVDKTITIQHNDTEKLKKYVKSVVDLFDDYISEYVIGIEVNEYLTQSQVDQLAQYVKSLTDKPVGCHMTSGQYGWSGMGSINKHYHQYGFGKPNSYIESETRKISGALNKPVIAAEYDKSSDSAGAKARGDAAIRGGASGTGNGRN